MFLFYSSIWLNYQSLELCPAVIIIIHPCDELSFMAILVYCIFITLYVFLFDAKQSKFCIGVDEFVIATDILID